MYLYAIVSWLTPLVNVVGCVIAFLAFLRCKKRGYVLVAIYFFLVVFSLLVMPVINGQIATRRQPDASLLYQQKMSQAITEAMDRVREEEGCPVMVHSINYDFPFGSIVLVAGLWMIVKKEKKQEPLDS